MIHHVTIGVSDLGRSLEFYGRVLATLGFDDVNTSDLLPNEVEFGTPDGHAFAISTDYPSEAPVHVAFLAASPEQVQAFHRAALASGGRDNGAPGRGPSTHRATTPPSPSIRTATTWRPSARPPELPSSAGRPRRPSVRHRRRHLHLHALPPGACARRPGGACAARRGRTCAAPGRAACGSAARPHATWRPRTQAPASAGGPDARWRLSRARTPPRPPPARPRGPGWSRCLTLPGRGPRRCRRRGRR